jgi:hypothetical protein
LASPHKGRLSREFPYEFLRRNCGHYIWDWLNGPEEDPATYIYLTPREALAKILSQYPPRRIRTIRSDLEILKTHIAKTPGTNWSDLRMAFADIRSLENIKDLRTRLLAIKVARSRADMHDYAFLQELQAESLAEAGGPEAARDVVEWQSMLNAQTAGPWPKEREGPAISAMATGYPDDDSQGFRITVEAGLRDAFTEPVPEHVLKVTQLLKGSVEGQGDSLKTEFILLSLATQRDSRSLLGGSSSGLSVGYTDLDNPLGASGLFASTWGGLSTQIDAGWLGIRLSLMADEIHDPIDLSAAAGLTWDLILADHAIHAELHQGSTDLGARLRHDALLSDSLTIRTEWTHSPDNLDVVPTGLQFRF